jgi:hypothetical protein
MELMNSGRIILVILIIFALYGLNDFNYPGKRVALAVKLLFIKISFRGIRICFKTGSSLFKNISGKTSDMLIYYKGTVYIIKLCGGVRSGTGITCTSDDKWFLSSINPSIVRSSQRDLDYDPDPEQEAEKVNFNAQGKAKNVGFDLTDERHKLHEAIDVSLFYEMKTMILFSPEPRFFVERKSSRSVKMKYGQLYNGNILANTAYLRILLKKSRETGIFPTNEDWNQISNEYKKYKGVKA